MKNNGYITYVNKKKPKKTFIVVALVAVAIFVILSAVGIFLDPYSNGANKEEIYSAVAENAELKSRIFELENEIERLNEKITGLESDIDDKDTQNGVNIASPSPTPDISTSPRNIVQ